MKPVFASLIVCAAGLAAPSIASADFTVFSDRAAWLAAAAGSAQVSENFDSFTTDLLYGSIPVAAGFLALSVVNGPSDNSWRIDAIPATFDTIPDVNGTTFAIILVNYPTYGGTKLTFNAVRAFGFDYAGSSYSTNSGILTTSRGDVASLAAAPNTARSFLGVLYTAGETFSSLTLSSQHAFAAGIDNVSAFAPVPELPVSSYLSAGLVAALALRHRGRIRVHSIVA